MGHHVVTVPQACPRCGAVGAQSFVAVSGDRLRTSGAFHCEGCGFGVEADGDLSDEARAAFVTAEGRWQLYIEEPGHDRAGVTKLVRNVAGIPVPDVPEVMRGEGALVDGVLAELEQVGDQLEKVGARVSKRRVG